MKLLSRTLLVAAASAAVSHATLITYEGFDYSTGPLDDNNGGTSWKEPWDVQSNNTQYNVSDSSPLSFGSLVTNGNYMNGGGSFTNAGRRVLANFLSDWDNAGRVSAPFLDEALDQGVVWGSFLLRINSDITSWDNMIITFQGDNNIPWDQTTANGARIVTTGGGTKTFEIKEGSAGSTVTTGITAATGTTYLFVTKWELSLTAGANNFYLWIFDNPSNVTLGGSDLLTGTADASLTGLNTEDLRFKNWAFYLDNAVDRISVDELRLGTTFASVTPVPEPATAAMLLGGAGFLILRRRVRA